MRLTLLVQNLFAAEQESASVLPERFENAASYSGCGAEINLCSRVAVEASVTDLGKSTADRKTVKRGAKRGRNFAVVGNAGIYQCGQNRGGCRGGGLTVSAVNRIVVVYRIG